MRYFMIWLRGDRSDPSLAFVRDPPDELGLHDYCMRRGEKIGENYPKSAKVRLDPRSPGIKLCSLLGNTLSYLMVNSAMKEVIIDVCKCEIETLPFTLYNHKRRLHSTDYCIVNPIGTFDCVNRTESDLNYSASDPKKVIGVNKLVFDPAKLAAAPDLFRVPEKPSEQFASEALVKAFQKIQVTNVLLKEIELKPVP